MRNLFNYILRHYFFFLFVLLQVVCFFLIAQNNTYHRSYFINTTNFLSGNIFRTRTHISDYFDLRRTNQQLLQENAFLRQATQASYLKTDQNIFTFQDTLYQRQFSYLNARVINNTVRSRNNYLTLNKGRIHGIRPDMGVIAHDGVIGIVKEVSANFSTVISLLHSDLQISARADRIDHIGTIIWEGYDYRKVTMLYIPPHVELLKGDSIVTSGFSQIFPEDILIGTISDFEIKRGDNFYTITVELSRDFNSLSYVSVVKNLFREEVTQLEASSRNQPR